MDLDSSHSVLKSLQAFHSGNSDQADLAQVLKRIGIIHDMRGQTELGRKYFTDALTEFQELGDSAMIGGMLNNLGASHFREGNAEQAVHYLEKALVYKERHGSKKSLSKTYLNVGIAHRDLDHKTEALKFTRRALEIKTQLADSSGIQGCLSNLGAIHHHFQESDSALVYYLRALELAGRLNMPERVIRGHKNLAQIHEKIGNYQLALDHSGIYHQLRDSLLSVESQAKIDELEIKYQTAEHQRELAEAQTALAESRVRNLWIGASCLLVLIIAAMLVYRYRSVQHARATAIVKGKQLESKRISELLWQNVGIPIASTTLEIPDDLKDHEQSLNSALEFTRFVANLHRNPYISAGLKPSLEFFINSIKEEKVMIFETDIEAIDMSEEDTEVAYNVIETLLFNSIQVQKAGTVKLGVRRAGDKIKINLESNSGESPKSGLYASAEGRVYLASGKIKTKVIPEQRTTTEILLPV